MDEGACYRYLLEVLHPDGLACPRCESPDTERLKRVLADSTPAMRDAVISGFAFKPDDLARVATPETLDQIVTNGLAIRLGDRSFAEEIYDDLRQQAIGIPERLHDARIVI